MMIPAGKLADHWDCAARKQGTTGGNDPPDCNWPFCGCDPYANKVIETVEESGFKIVKADASDGNDPTLGSAYERYLSEGSKPTGRGHHAEND